MSVESKLFFPQPIITPIITRLIFFSPTFPRLDLCTNNHGVQPNNPRNTL